MMNKRRKALARLFRLPVKALARFKCVSKKWNHFISNDSYFCTNYIPVGGTPLMLGIFHNTMPLNGIFYRPEFLPSFDEAKTMLMPRCTPDINGDANISLLLSNDNLTSICHWSSDLEKSLGFVVNGHEKLVITLSYNGYILCYPVVHGHPFEENYFICNPITKEWLSLPPDDNENAFVSDAFICNQNCTEYKVARFIWPHNLGASSTTLRVKTLDQAHENWEEFNLTASCPFRVAEFSSGVISEKSGLVYWLAWKVHDGSDINAVMVFDQPSLQLEFIESPLQKHNMTEDFLLGQANGRILYCIFNHHHIHMWVLDEDKRAWSFPLEYNVEYINHNISRLEAFHPFDQSLILLELKSHNIVWLNLETEEMIVVRDQNNCPLRFVPYIWPSWPPSFSLFKTSTADECARKSELLKER